MKRVVFLKSRAGFQGGLEKYTRELLTAFGKKNCAVTLLTTGVPPSVTGVEAISLSPDSKFSLYQLIRFNHLCQRWLKENRADLVFGMERTTSHTHYRAGNGVHAEFLQRRKLVDSVLKRASLPLNPLHRQLLRMERAAMEDPHLKVLFTNSHMVREEILNTYGTDPNKIEVVHNGVEWSCWSADFEESLQTKKPKPFHFLFIGNGYKRKGLLFLLQGLEQMKQEDFLLTVVGKDKNIPFFTHWVEKRGFADKVRFLGPQEQVLSYYKQADALVLPSIYDPFANVTVEALSMGLFVLTSPFNGGSEVLSPYSGEIVEDLRSAHSWAQALKKAMNHPKTEGTAMKIRQSIKHLDFTHQLDKIVSLSLCHS